MGHRIRLCAVGLLLVGLSAEAVAQMPVPPLLPQSPASTSYQLPAAPPGGAVLGGPTSPSGPPAAAPQPFAPPAQAPGTTSQPFAPLGPPVAAGPQPFTPAPGPAPGAPFAPVPAPPPGPAPLFAPPSSGFDGWGSFGLPPGVAGLFAGVDLFFLQPSIHGTLRGTTTPPGGTTETVTPAGANLDFTVSPRFDAGWRLPDNCGGFELSYRFIASTGSAQVNDPVGLLDARTRLNMNVFDFDYVSALWAPWPRYYLTYHVGVVLETVFYDNQDTIGPTFIEKGNNYFVGAGPHASVEFGREINVIPGLSAFALLDVGAAFGQAKQEYSDALAVSTPSFNQQRTEMATNLTVQAGLSYRPPGLPWLHFYGGFQYERFWDVGSVGNSSGDVQDIGGFVGAVFDF